MIVIPMAGLSRRFSDAGYTLPKYMLPLYGSTVFAHAIKGFKACFDQETFLFVGRDIARTEDFIRSECSALGIRHCTTVMLERETAGQAETVALGLEEYNVPEDMPITIFNIDTFRQGFSYPDEAWFEESHGYLEVFRGSGANWSFVRPAEGDEPLAAETAEKRPISDLCCTGLYHFARAADFREALLAERGAPSAPELYVAPLYNHLIRRGKHIHYAVVPAEEITFCGVPAEYEALLAQR